MPTEIEIDNLIQKAQAGDEQALARLFDSYRDKLRRMVQVRMDPRLRARIDEDDVLQDAYVELTRVQHRDQTSLFSMATHDHG